MPSAQDILNDATAAKDALHRLESALNEQIDSLAFTALKEGRDLTAAERSKRDQYRAAVAAVESSFDELGFITLTKLNHSNEVKNLLHDISEENSQLDDDLKQLKQVEAIAQEVADVAAQLPKVVQGLAQILPLLGLA
jgi:hypothetical protein